MEPSSLNVHERLVSPPGLADYINSLPFLGQITASAHQIEAGSYQELLFTYVVGASGIADSGRLKITFKFYSDWADPQTEDPAASNYLTAEFVARQSFPGESPATVQSLKVRFDPKGHERPFQKTILIDVIDGYIRPGDRIEVRVGDRRGGGPGSRVQTFVEDAFRFRAYVDTAGTSRLATVPDDITIQILAGPPVLLRLITPRSARPGVSLPVVARLEDAWGNVCRDLSGRVQLRPTGLDAVIVDLPATGPAVVSHSWLFQADVDNVIDAESVLAGGTALRASAPLTIDAALPFPRALFADLHIHSHDTVGTNSTEYNLRYARDVAALDIFGYTVNDFQVTAANWEKAVALCRTYHEENRFVVFPGTEWCGNSAAGGDHNVVFLNDNDIRFPLDPAHQSIRSFEWHENQGEAAAHAPRPGRWPISDWYAAHADAPEHFLMIPHVGGRRAILDWHQLQLERLVEIASSWGHFQWLYDEALARGYRVGASAAGDEHRGRPGGGAPGASIFGVHGGLTGVLCSSLDRKHVAAELRARHTWATTGERNVALLRAGIHLQGDAFEAAPGRPLTIHYQLLGQAGWEYVALRDHQGVVWERDLHQEHGYAPNRLRIRWGGARVKDRYRWADWRLRVEIQGSVVLDWHAHGLEHPEEQVAQTSPGVFDITTTTCGDADGLILDLASLTDATINVTAEISGVYGPHTTAPIHLKSTGPDILATRGHRKDLGGVELFLAMERVTAKPLSLNVQGSVSIDPKPGPHGGAYPVYLFAREIDDAKVWSSPLFITK